MTSHYQRLYRLAYAWTQEKSLAQDTISNVLITAHQAFYTHEALTNIVETTLENIKDYEQGTINPKNCVIYHDV